MVQWFPYRGAKRDMRLKRIAIENIGGIESVELDLTHPETGEALPCVVLFGANGSGKSTILRALAWILGGEPGGQFQFPQARRAKPPWRIALDILGDEGREVSVTTTIQPRTPASETNALEKPQRYDAPSDWRRHIVASEIPDRWQIAALLGPEREIHPSKVSSVQLESTFDQPNNALSRGRYSGLKQWLINERYKWFEAREQGGGTQERFHHRLWSEFEKFIAPKSFDGIEGFEVWFRDAATGIRCTLDELSSGEQSLLLLFAEIFMREAHDSIILIDEVDAHLHVTWQLEILHSLQRLCPQGQIIATTHQPLVLEGVPPEQRRRLPSPGEGTVAYGGTS